MSVEHVEFLVEEPSMENFLRGLLPRILGDVSFEIYPSQGKAELLEHLPDRLRGYVPGGNWEAFERILNRAGYFDGGLRKVEAARTLAQYVDPDRNRSRSFQVFYSALVEITR